MNINEVISNIAALKTNSELGSHHPIHPNDDVNKSQSTNDTFPAAIQISVVTQIIKKLVPSIKELTKVLDSKSNKWKDLIKIGRTHFLRCSANFSWSRSFCMVKTTKGR